MLWTAPSGEHPTDVVFMCMWETCVQRFALIEDLESHLSFHCTMFSDIQRNSVEELMCRVRGCEVSVGSLDELSRHLKMHIFHAHRLIVGLKQIRFRHPQLTTCNFLSSSRLVYQGDALICEWGNCTLTFIDINKYMTHLTGHVESVSENRCLWGGAEQACRMLFKSKNALRIHIQHHSGDKSCACPFCGAFFASNTKLFDHVTRRQKAEENFSCFFCQKNFKTERILKQHCQRHVRNFQCNFCSMALESAFDLQRHVSTVHAKIRNHFCEVCGKGFFQKTDLNRHTAIHTDDFFECSVCNQRFRWEKQLKYHAKSHEPDFIELPYNCHLCTAKYRRGSALSKHFSVRHQLSPSEGFSRFQYKKCADGLFRLQTKRWTGKELLHSAVDTVDNSGDTVGVNMMSL